MDRILASVHETIRIFSFDWPRLGRRKSLLRKAFLEKPTYLILTILAVFLSACEPITVSSVSGGVKHLPTSTAVAPREYPVDKVFKEFYQTLGGRQVLGPAISLVEEREGNLRCQFTEAVLMCFNSQITGPDRFSLYPLGKDLNLQEDAPIDSGLSPEGGRVVDGILIYEKFVTPYDRLYGARYVGRPLTRLRHNYKLQRVEQYFENVGFYQNMNSPNGEVKLISYGAYLCGAQCSYKLNEYWGIIESNQIAQPFAPSIGRLGGPGVFGEPLLQPRVASDGYLEQVYTNAVFYGLPEDPSVVGLRPLTKMLSIVPGPLVPPKSHEKLVFYEIEPGLGHNIPTDFDKFIALHGGYDLSGKPISEVVRLADQNLYQQCFENYCLIYDPAASSSLKVRLKPLGRQLIGTLPPEQVPTPEKIFTPDRITLASGVDKPNLNPGEEQFVRIVVQQKSGQSGEVKPLDRVEATLVITYPDATVARYFFPPTDPQGSSVVVIPPRSSLEHGDRIIYQVCLNLPSEQPICDMQSYLIWKSK